MRLYLEGKFTDRLAIHLQHLYTTPTLFSSTTTCNLRWHDSSVVAAGNDNYYEPLDWKRLSRVCTAPVEPDPDWLPTLPKSAYVVSGAQLQMDSRNSTLHLRLLFTELPGCIITSSIWERGAKSLSSGPSGLLQISGILSSVAERQELAEIPKVVVDSGVFVGGPPATGVTKKLKKYVDTGERCKGPEDSPGYWVVTGAKLELEKGRIGLHVRFSLLTMLS